MQHQSHNMTASERVASSPTFTVLARLSMMACAGIMPFLIWLVVRAADNIAQMESAQWQATMQLKVIDAKLSTYDKIATDHEIRLRDLEKQRIK